MAQELLGKRIAKKLPSLDPLADFLQPRLRRALASSLPLRNFLDGTWFRSPLHPALTDVPIGASTTAFLLDLGHGATRSTSLGIAADRALAVGILGSLPAALTGASDWRDLRGETRRIALLHGLLNGGSLLLNIASLTMRLRGDRAAGKLASATALLTTSLAGHIGGELSFGLGIRVNRTAWQHAPDHFTAVADAADIQGEDLHRVELEGQAVLLSGSRNGTLCAIAATCSHMGGPLDQGKRDGDTVTCPWHGSRFDLCTGDVIDGPAVFPEPSYEVEERDGKIELRRR